MNDFEVIGTGVILFGVLFLVIGLLTGFSRQFILTGDLLLFVGLFVYFRFRGFFSYAARKERLIGIGVFVVGVILVIFKLALPGFIVECGGLYWMLGGFFGMLKPLVSGFLHLGKSENKAESFNL